MKRKICVITGTRADYGLLRWVMQGIKDDSDINLQVIATGMHLSPEFGSTYKVIEQDGFYIDRKVEMLTSSDTTVGIAKSMGLGLIGFSDALNELNPDVILVLGDRFEILSAVSTALVLRIPVAHLHGGESTEGVIDEGIRHSITKMSHLHFVAAEQYRQRVIQLGEQPDKVFLVGGLGIDNIKRIDLLDRAELEVALDFSLGVKNLLVTFHPVTLEEDMAETQIMELLSALEELEETHIVFTLPNADADGRKIMAMVEEFVSKNLNSRVYTSLGQLRYLSCIEHMDGIVGNSSSGLIEAPSFKKGTVNIGDRQKGRLQAGSVINCDPQRGSIAGALVRLYSSEFQAELETVINPYGMGGASDAIVSIVKSIPLDEILKKRFYDLDRSFT